jgi:glycosyltransferase involved in cell wall biosynthesis
VLRLPHLVTAPSEFLAEIIERRTGTPVFIVPNILDTTIFQYRQRTSVRPKIVVARHLEPIYDIESVLKAFRQIQERYPDSVLDIAGSGNQRQYLEGLARQWGLRNVRFLGHVAHDALPSIYENCDIFLNASRVDNFPGALLEASATGLIVVSTCAGGIPYIYEHEKNALLVNVGAWQGLAGAVERIVESPSLGPNLSREALKVVERCHWNQVRNSLYQAYGFPADGGQKTFGMCGSLDRAVEEKC